MQSPQLSDPNADCDCDPNGYPDCCPDAYGHADPEPDRERGGLPDDG